MTWWERRESEGIFKTNRLKYLNGCEISGFHSKLETLGNYRESESQLALHNYREDESQLALHDLLDGTELFFAIRERLKKCSWITTLDIR